MSLMLEQQVDALKARRRLSALIQSLVDDERWIALCQEVKRSQRNAFMAVMNRALPLDQLRWWQGYYTALTVISQDRQANKIDMDSMEEELQKLDHDKELRDMLAEGDLPDTVKNELLRGAGFL